MTFVWALVGLLLSQQIHLSQWALYRPGQAKAGSKQRQLSRWLHNRKINPSQVYGPLIKRVLRAWANQRLYLALDSSSLWGRFTLVRLALIYRGRALPLCWLVLSSQSASVGYADYHLILRQAAALIPVSCQVVLLADRGFGDVKLFQLARDLGWSFRIRLKGSLWVYRANQPRTKVGRLMPAKGQALFVHKVWLTQQGFGPVYLALAHVQTANGYEQWAIVSDEPTDLQTLTEYGFRFDIEIVFTQMTKARLFAFGTGGDNIPDFHTGIVNDDPVNQQFYQLPALGKVKLVQGWFNTSAKILNVRRQFGYIELSLGLEFKLAQLLMQSVLGLVQFLPLAFKLISADNFSQEHFQQASLLAFKLGQSLCNTLTASLQGLGQPFSSLGALQFVRNQIRVS
jgi:hypothetical protein